MPNIPVTWRDEQTVNTVTTGAQTAPDIIQLTNGNILVAWTSASNSGAGSPPSRDIIGRIYDPLGNAVGGEFLINTAFSSDGEEDVSLAARTDGGFVAVYEDTDIDFGFTSIRLQNFSADGTPTVSNSVIVDTSTAAPNYSNPAVAVSSGTSMLIAYNKATSGGPTLPGLFGQIYDPITNTFGSEFAISSLANDPSITVLANGNYVVAGSLIDRITYTIVSPAGATVLAATTVIGTSTSPGDRDPSVAAVPASDGGGFILAWERDTATGTEIAFRRYDSAGVQIGEGAFGDSASVFKTPVVDVLADGTFMISYRDSPGGAMVAHHFSETGASLGPLAFSSVGTNPAATALGDGRYAVAWENTATEISLEILDTRNAINNPGVYTPDQWQVGTIGVDNFTADAVSEFVHAWDGNDRLTESGEGRSYFGDAGDDVLVVTSDIVDDFHDGGAGNDTIDWSASTEANASFNLVLGLAVDVGGSQSELMIGFENVIGTNQNDFIFGKSDANSLSGLDGDDRLDGGSGADTMRGGHGNDIYVVDDAGDLTLELAGAGIDVVESSIRFTLGANLERLVLTGSASINGAGNALDNLLVGNAGNNLLNGLAGADIMRGGLGNDRYIVDQAGDVVEETSASGGTDVVQSAVTFTLGANIEQLTLTGTASINGAGNGLANQITGNNGSNVLNGLAGADTMRGGFGNDTYVVDNAGDRALESSPSGGFDSVQTGLAWTLGSNLERLILTGSSNVNGAGNALDNILIGNAGNNVLNGFAGTDTLRGGLGDDVYIVDNAGDVAEENAGAGNDRVQSSVSFTLGTNIEELFLTGSGNFDGTGNAGVNVINGNGGSNVLDGRAGADLMRGGLGNDTYVVDNEDDVAQESSALGGTDTVQSSASFVLGNFVENLFLTGSGAVGGTGNGLANTLTGNGGANLLRGKGGNDVLDGGAGSDGYIFDTALDAANNVDSIVAFEAGVDEIVLENAVFVGLAGGALSADAFRIGTGAADADDRIVYDSATGALFFDPDGNGAAAQVQFATLAGGLALSASDFTVV